ncbi:ferredoxin reductase family protein [Sedimenticola sp.]|uniref:ferredoxin reductase family protein n=1 Tax=Sedimenticola sp. TaxID=1940285 RepID=UPI002584D891|nr:ferric reductase-like transmembrane domain-containing protein [Sedimenticola sp.]MCW8903861.1 ferric reductase-like transmembrane domain-containing protein [Sedimenticola sp.]
MKTILAGFVAIVALAWGVEMLSPDHTTASSLPWTIYLESLFLTGLISIALMSLAMVLASRPAWLEQPLGGMDRIYRLHKWSGILAVVFAASHWLLEMSDDLFKALAGRGGRIKEDELSAFAEPLRDLGEALGEWAFYVLLALLALTLWKQFSYRLWRPLHRAMPVLYLLLVFHSVVLAPATYSSQPIGLLLAVLFTAGSIASVQSLTGRIGRKRRASGSVIAVRNPSPDIIEVSCRLDGKWRGHQPGQFAFVTFDAGEGAHPFTIASADRGDHTVTFAIKALGDYTRTLARKLAEASPVEVEGPYGRFELSRTNNRARQIWVAGGIGITPFIAWLESLQDEQATEVSADLHYSVRDREADPFVERLQSLCATLPKVQLHVYDKHSGPLNADTLAAELSETRRAEVWFCGPRGFADALREGLQAFAGRVRFHQEAFEMR